MALNICFIILFLSSLSIKPKYNPNVPVFQLVESEDIASQNKEDIYIETNKVNYSNYELDLLSRLIFAEAGSDWLSDEHQLAVGSVVLNRVKDSRFPNTIHSVIYQTNPIQYACTTNGTINKTPNQRAINNARYLLENGSVIPEDIVWQSTTPQGKGVWRVIQGHYFCY